MIKFVKIPLEEYITLCNDSLRLSYLESAGVDNWEPGYSFNDYLRDSEIDLEEGEYTARDFRHLIIKE